jgi:hypothetical protein
MTWRPWRPLFISPYAKAAFENRLRTESAAANERWQAEDNRRQAENTAAVEQRVVAQRAEKDAAEQRRQAEKAAAVERASKAAEREEASRRESRARVRTPPTLT